MRPTSIASLAAVAALVACLALVAATPLDDYIKKPEPMFAYADTGVRLGGEEIRLRGLEARLLALESGLVEVGTNLDQEITLLDPLAFLDGQLDDFASDLRADLHLDDRLQLPAAGDDLGEVPPLGLLRDDGKGGVAVAACGREQEPGEDQGRGGDVACRHVDPPWTRLVGNCFRNSRGVR
jgi:hypothetical protein